jgi:hypothetical protein
MKDVKDTRNDNNGGVCSGSNGATYAGTRKLRGKATKERSRMSLSVDAELRQLLADAACQCKERTASKTIRWALKRALAPIPPVTLGLKIIKWAEKLPFKSPRDEMELRTLVREMYRELK